MSDTLLFKGNDVSKLNRDELIGLVYDLTFGKYAKGAKQEGIHLALERVRELMSVDDLKPHSSSAQDFRIYMAVKEFGREILTKIDEIEKELTDPLEGSTDGSIKEGTGR